MAFKNQITRLSDLIADLIQGATIQGGIIQVPGGTGRRLELGANAGGAFIRWYKASGSTNFGFIACDDNDMQILPPDFFGNANVPVVDLNGETANNKADDEFIVNAHRQWMNAAAPNFHRTRASNLTIPSGTVTPISVGANVDSAPVGFSAAGGLSTDWSPDRPGVYLINAFINWQAPLVGATGRYDIRIQKNGNAITINTDNIANAPGTNIESWATVIARLSTLDTITLACFQNSGSNNVILGTSSGGTTEFAAYYLGA